jgi:VanZ family protein
MSNAVWQKRWWIWSVYLAAWSAALLVPVPGGHWDLPDLHVNLRLLVAKTLHFCAYALLAILTGWVRAPARWRFVLMFVLMGHASLTEMLQFWLAFIGRSGTLTDVALDHAGIAVGMALSWKWWSESPA